MNVKGRSAYSGPHTLNFKSNDGHIPCAPVGARGLGFRA